MTRDGAVVGVGVTLVAHHPVRETAVPAVGLRCSTLGPADAQVPGQLDDRPHCLWTDSGC